jgi:SAM-dependent methyltransferase
MSSPNTDKVFTGSIPGFYETHLVPLIFEPYAADLANRLASRSVTRVLEIAAGTGVATRSLASTLPENVSIVATDLNQPMLDQAAAIGTKRPVEWRQADAMQLPFQDGMFDAVVCQFGAMFFPEKSKAFSEARRMLRPGGVFIFNVWDRIEENEFANTVTTALESLFPRDPPRFLARTPHGYYDHPAIERDLANGGFTAPSKISTVAARSRATSSRVPAVAYCQGDTATKRDRGARRLAAWRRNRHRRGSYRPELRTGGRRRQDSSARCHHRKLMAALLRGSCTSASSAQLMAEGGKVAVRVDDDVVGATEVRKLKRKIREREQLPGKKTMEAARSNLNTRLGVALVKPAPDSTFNRTCLRQDA